MSLPQFKTLEKRIKYLLINYPQVRDNDRHLYYLVCKSMGLNVEISFKDWCRSNYPNTESVRRCRAKIQSKYPELQSSDKAQNDKNVKQKIYKKWSTS
jgi:hypothetical protein